MIQVLGRTGSKSRKLLEGLLREGEGVVSWGVEKAGVLGGTPRVDAVEQLRRFKDAGLQVPEFTTDLPTACGWVAGGDLVFGRRLLHSEGRDIVGPKHRRWKQSEYWVKVIPKVLQEWRIHVFQGRSIARGVKVQTGPTRRKMPVRNRRNGWTMVHGEVPPKGVRGLAKKAVAALGYDFGAVDVLVGEDGGQWVLEVNRAPGLDLSTATAYAKAIRGVLR